MCNVLRTYLAPLVLLFALFFLTGAATAMDSLSGQAKTDLCCQQEADPSEAPTSDTECSDSSCRCLSCSVPLLFKNQLSSLLATKSRPLWDWSWFVPSAPGRSIDYPPEHA